MTAAADRLGLSQAAVSQAVLALEQALGVRLFDRSVRPPALTLIGQSAARRAAEVLASAHRFEDEVRFGRGARVPLLRIGMLDSFASTVGAHVLHRLRDVAAQWTVASGYRATRLQALTERVSDVIVTSDSTPVPPGVEALPVLSESFVLAVPAAHAGEVRDIGALATQLDFIRYGRDAHMGPQIERYLEQAGAQAPQRFQFDTTDAALGMVAGGFGWTIMTPLICLKSRVDVKSVRVCPLPGAPMTRRIIVAMRQGEGSEIARSLRDAATGILNDVILPSLRITLPEVAALVEVPAST